MEKIKELWGKVEDWFYDVSDSFAFLIGTWAVTVSVSIWLYRTFFVKPIRREFDRRFGSISK